MSINEVLALLKKVLFSIPEILPGLDIPSFQSTQVATAALVILLFIFFLGLFHRAL